MWSLTELENKFLGFSLDGTRHVISHTQSKALVPVSVPALIGPNTSVPASVRACKLTPWHPTPSRRKIDRPLCHQCQMMTFVNSSNNTNRVMYPKPPLLRWVHKYEKALLQYPVQRHRWQLHYKISHEQQLFILICIKWKCNNKITWHQETGAWTPWKISNSKRNRTTPSQNGAIHAPRDCNPGLLFQSRDFGSPWFWTSKNFL